MATTGWRFAGASQNEISLLTVTVSTVVLGYALLTGFLVAAQPTIALGLVGAPLLMTLLARSARFRLLFFTVAGILVLDVSEGVGLAKLLYGGGALAAVVFSLFNLRAEPHPALFSFRRLAPWLLAVLAVVIGGALANGNDPQAIVRVGMLYFLAVGAPAVGLDAGRYFTSTRFARFVLLFGIFAAVAFGIAWTSRRGVAVSSADAFAAPTYFVPILAFAIATILAVEGVGVTKWLARLTMAIVPAGLLLSGNRTALMFLIPLLAVVGSSGLRKASPPKFALILSGVIGVSLLILQFAASAVLADPAFLTKRLYSVANLGEHGLEADSSFTERSAQVDSALTAIADSPLLGQGVGSTYGISIDNGLATVARLGIVGSAAVIACFVVCLRALRSVESLYGRSVYSNAFRGLILAVAATTPLISAVDDRGFGLAVALAFAGVSCATADASRRNLLASTTKNI